ncbi:MAG: GTP 3',8-cyclase MoaA [Anaeromyxobacteraceae bacterium]|nr:GTP 3',8-cyclase MoaA [Anaeromyxobacteraceae bacterium]
MPEAPLPLSDRPLADAQGRAITYLRLSLTDRCNFRCSYCAPLGQEHHEDPLTRDEVARLVSIFARLGVRRVRLTGGEPTLRRDLLDIVAAVGATPGIEEIALTTNGQSLAELAGPLRAAGVTRVNVSLDSLDPEKLARIAGRAASLDRIVRGIRAAHAAGFASVKLNVVVVRGVNDGELAALARFGWSAGAIVRFIELMPFGEGEPVPVAEVKALLQAQGVRLEPDASRGWGPAYHMRGEAEAAGRPISGLLGFIGAMSENFCAGCNRVRVAADGSLRACLGGRDKVALKPLLRDEPDDRAVADRIVAALLLKRDRHQMERGGELLTMIGTGG